MDNKTTNKTPINEESLKFLAAEELMYHPEYTQEDIDRMCEEGHRQYLEMMAEKKREERMLGLLGKTYSSKKVAAALLGSLLIGMSGCAGGELYAGFRGYNNNNHNESYTPEQAKADLRSKY